MGIIRSLNKFRFVRGSWLILLLLVPLVLWVLPADYFDAAGIATCPSKAFFDIECFGCGMTRAVMHFHHFEFNDALYFNYGVLLVYPALVVYWFIFVKSALKNLNLSLPFLSKW